MSSSGRTSAGTSPGTARSSSGRSSTSSRLRCERHRALDGVLELAHVARPGVAQKLVGRPGREAVTLRPIAAPRPPGAAGEPQDVLAPLAQRRDAQLDDAQPVVEILPEAPRVHLRQQVAVGGRHHAHVHLAAPVLSHPPHLALLQRAQELHLHGRRHLADLVQEERAAVGRLEQARPILRGAGEGALGVAEQLASSRLSGTAPQLMATNGRPPAWTRHG